MPKKKQSGLAEQKHNNKHQNLSVKNGSNSSCKRNKLSKDISIIKTNIGLLFTISAYLCDQLFLSDYTIRKIKIIQNIINVGDSKIEKQLPIFMKYQVIYQSKQSQASIMDKVNVMDDHNHHQQKEQKKSQKKQQCKISLASEIRKRRLINKKSKPNGLKLQYLCEIPIQAYTQQIKKIYLLYFSDLSFKIHKIVMQYIKKMDININLNNTTFEIIKKIRRDIDWSTNKHFPKKSQQIKRSKKLFRTNRQKISDSISQEIQNRNSINHHEIKIQQYSILKQKEYSYSQNLQKRELSIFGLRQKMLRTC